MNVIVFGAGGHGKVIVDILKRMPSYSVVCVGDDREALNGTTVLGIPVVAPRDRVVVFAREHSVQSVIVGIGHNPTRALVARWFDEQGFQLAKAIHPSSILGEGATVEAGTVIMAGVIINSDTHVGRNTIINTGSRIDHDCTIGNNVHIAPGVILCGGVNVGNNSLIGAGAVILPYLSVADSATVGAGSTVSHSVESGDLVVGIRAKPVKRRNSM